jgi:hypothetical protein
VYQRVGWDVWQWTPQGQDNSGVVAAPSTWWCLCRAAPPAAGQPGDTSHSAHTRRPCCCCCCCCCTHTALISPAPGIAATLPPPTPLWGRTCAHNLPHPTPPPPHLLLLSLGHVDEGLPLPLTLQDAGTLAALCLRLQLHGLRSRGGVCGVGGGGGDRGAAGRVQGGGSGEVRERQLCRPCVQRSCVMRKHATAAHAHP